jgi:hypothetical protein
MASLLPGMDFWKLDPMQLRNIVPNNALKKGY